MKKRTVRVCGDVAYIALTKGYEAVIDSSMADSPDIFNFNWCAVVAKNSVYAMRVIKVNGERKTILLHQLIMGFPGCEVDHKDMDGLNNRSSNLRSATKSQNACNRKINSQNKSGFKGVFFHSQSQKWEAGIEINGKKIYLGRFRNKDDAINARISNIEKYHGEFARID